MNRFFLLILIFFFISSTAQDSKIFENCLKSENISDTLVCLENCIMLFICYEINNDLSLFKLNKKQENLNATIGFDDDGSLILEDYDISNLTLLSSVKRVVFFTSKEAEKIKNSSQNLIGQKIQIDLTFSNSTSENVIAKDKFGKTFYEFKAIKKTDDTIVPPIFPGCKFKDIEKRKKCMSTKIDKFIKKNYNSSIINDIENLEGLIIIEVSFIVNTQGKVSKVSAKGPHLLLEKEAIRVLNSLPKMIPGQVNGKDVNLFYTLPIYLNVE